MMRCGIGLATLVLFFSVSSSSARTWLIKVNGTGDAPTIQAGCDSAQTNDTVLVAPGTYTWANQGTGTDYGMFSILRGSADMTIVSQSGPEVTILDGQYQGRICFFQGETELTIDGFTFKRGAAPALGSFIGGGFAAHLSSPVVKNSIFTDNSAGAGGAYWYGGVGAPQLVNCLFENNHSDAGGAVLLINSYLQTLIDHCTFRRNESTGAGGAIYANNVLMLIRDTVFDDNTAGTAGGGVRAINLHASTIRRCTFYENGAPVGATISSVASPLTINRCILAFGQFGPAVDVDLNSALVFSCSDIFGHASGDWTGIIASQLNTGGNFSADPHFCAPGSGNFELAADSPCVAGNHPAGTSCGQIGAFTAGCGSVPTENSTWGRIKSIYAPDR